jgi:hypothetical protein
VDRSASAILSILAQHIDTIPSVKFFITARPELPIRTSFHMPLLRVHTEVFSLHQADKTSIDHDIELYLQIHLSETATQRLHWDVTVPWPTDQQITTIIKKCSGLFIVASVIVKFVRSCHHQPQDCLDLIISCPDDTIYEGKSRVDVIYHHILVQSFKEIDIDDTNIFGWLQLVVSSIILAFNPLSHVSLARILNMPPDGTGHHGFAPLSLPCSRF